MNSAPIRMMIMMVCAFFGAVAGFKSISVITNGGPPAAAVELMVKIVGGTVGSVLGLLIGASFVGLSILLSKLRSSL